jgi:FAD/FMN-containing dehydrogenase
MGAGVRVGDWSALQGAIAGEVLLPGSRAYELARAPALANFDDVRPRAVVRCADPADVVETLAFARRLGVHVAPRSGGHCFAGRSSTEGVVIDVTPMRAVSVSGDVATIGAGARLSDVYDALDDHDLTIPAGCGPTVGIAGLTLGGGLGLLGRKHGLTSDRLLAARVVLADGRVVDCDEHHDADLFWALRGAGGGRFGVVTSLVFAAVPAPAATVFRLTWPLGRAAAVIAAWQDWAVDGPDELSANAQLTAGAVTVAGALLAGEAETVALLGALVDGAGADPETASHEHLPYREVKRALAQEEDGPRRRFGKSELYRRPLPVEAIEALVGGFAGGEVNFIPMGGAYNRVPADATAFAHRAERFLVEHAAENSMQWVVQSWACLHPWGSGRVYPNFPEPDLADWDEAYYASNRERLLRVKRTYDPDGVFRFRPPR